MKNIGCQQIKGKRRHKKMVYICLNLFLEKLGRSKDSFFAHIKKPVSSVHPYVINSNKIKVSFVAFTVFSWGMTDFWAWVMFRGMP